WVRGLSWAWKWAQVGMCGRLPNPIPPAWRAREMNDGPPVWVGLGKAFQNLAGIPAFTLAIQRVFAQAALTSLHQCLNRVILRQSKRLLRHPPKDRFTARRTQDDNR